MGRTGEREIGEYGHLNNFLKNCQCCYIVNREYDVGVMMRICDIGM